jgi:hypothetical protein
VLCICLCQARLNVEFPLGVAVLFLSGEETFEQVRASRCIQRVNIRLLGRSDKMRNGCLPDWIIVRNTACNLCKRELSGERPKRECGQRRKARGLCRLHVVQALACLVDAAENVRGDWHVLRVKLHKGSLKLDTALDTQHVAEADYGQSVQTSSHDGKNPLLKPFFRRTGNHDKQ